MTSTPGRPTSEPARRVRPRRPTRIRSSRTVRCGSATFRTQRVRVDEANGSRNVAVLYAAGSFDSLVTTYDECFAGIGDTIKQEPRVAWRSWQSATEGYPVVVTDQGNAVSVVLQTGV